MGKLEFHVNHVYLRRDSSFFISSNFSFPSIDFVSISWSYFLITLIWMILTHVMEIPVEESECIKKYGTDYIEYMKKTPKWLGIPRARK